MGDDEDLQESWISLKPSRGGKGWVTQLEGEAFGLLTVVSRAGANKFGKAMWLCKCSCGGTKTTTGALLQRGAVRSCGCLRKKAGSPKPKRKRARLHPLVAAARRVQRERARGQRNEE